MFLWLAGLQLTATVLQNTDYHITYHQEQSKVHNSKYGFY
jgi:hypothetical protein